MLISVASLDLFELFHGHRLFVDGNRVWYVDYRHHVIFSVLKSHDNEEQHIFLHDKVVDEVVDIVFVLNDHDKHVQVQLQHYYHLINARTIYIYIYINLLPLTKCLS